MNALTLDPADGLECSTTSAELMNIMTINLHRSSRAIKEICIWKAMGGEEKEEGEEGVTTPPQDVSSHCTLKRNLVQMTR